METALLTVELPGDEPSPAAAAAVLGIAADRLDPDFGVVAIDPARHLYAVRVDAGAVGEAVQREGVHGPHADPRIEPI